MSDFVHKKSGTEVPLSRMYAKNLCGKTQNEVNQRFIFTTADDEVIARDEFTEVAFMLHLLPELVPAWRIITRECTCRRFPIAMNCSRRMLKRRHMPIHFETIFHLDISHNRTNTIVRHVAHPGTLCRRRHGELRFIRTFHDIFHGYVGQMKAACTELLWLCVFECICHSEPEVLRFWLGMLTCAKSEKITPMCCRRHDGVVGVRLEHAVCMLLVHGIAQNRKRIPQFFRQFFHAEAQRLRFKTSLSISKNTFRAARKRKRLDTCIMHADTPCFHSVFLLLVRKRKFRRHAWLIHTK